MGESYRRYGLESLLNLFMDNHDVKWRRAAFAFLAITTVLRLALLPLMELAPDEAYYWDWSRRPALGYYDQGPFIAYLIRTTTAVFGTNEFAVRFGVLLASLGTLLCCYLLAARIFSPKAGFLTVLILGVTPLMTVGSLIATYDPPMVFFWALTALLLERALFPPALPEQPRREGQSAAERAPFAPTFPEQSRYWLLAGLAAGLGFLSKHTMLLVLPCLLVFLLASPPHRFWLRRPEPYAAFGLILLLYTGVFVWNIQHHGWTFGHLLFLAKKSSQTPLQRLGDYLGSQAALLGPVLFLALLRLKGRGKIENREQGTGKREKEIPEYLNTRTPEHLNTQHPTPNTQRQLFLLCFGLPVFLFFCILALKAKVQGNWAVCAWLTLTVLWCGLLTEMPQKKATRWITATVLTSGLLTVLFLSPGLRSNLGLRLPPESDLSNTTTGWRETAARVQQVRREMETGGRPVFVAANDYQYAAEMAFYLPDHPQTQDLFLHFRLTMYAAYIDNLKNHLGADAVFVNENEVEDKYLRQIFESVTWDEPYPIYRKPYYAGPIRTVHIARCHNFRRYVGLEWAEGG